MSGKKDLVSRTDPRATASKEFAMEVSIELKQIKQSGSLELIQKELCRQLKLSQSYHKLTDECIYKFAISQDDDFLGVLYVEIPHKYKSQKKFKIEDWQPLKGLGSSVKKASEDPYLVWVVIHYTASSTLDLTAAKSETLSTAAPSSKVGERLKEINKDIRDHEKEGFNFLDDVERKIRDRRRRNVTQIATERSPSKPGKNTGMSLGDSPSKILQYPLSNNKKHDLGTSHKKSKSPRKLPPGKAVTPDDLYSAALSKLTKTDSTNNTDRNLAQELTTANQEIVRLRAKVKALEDGQMSVDNLSLTKVLEKEQAELNRQRAKLLKDFADKDAKLDDELAKAKMNNKEFADKFTEQKAEIEREKNLHREREAELIDREEELKRREDALENKYEKFTEEQKEINAIRQQAEKDRNELAEYAAELDELKERLVAERNKLIEGKGKADMTRAELERDTKDVEQARKILEAENKALEREKQKMQQQIASQQQSLASQQQTLKDSQEELDRLRKVLDDKSKATGATQGTLEEERIEVWKERNKLANELSHLT